MEPDTVKQLNLRVDAKTYDLFTTFASSRDLSKAQALTEAVDALKREEFIKRNPSFDNSARAVRSHLDAVAKAFEQLVEDSAEVERSTREDCAKTVACREDDIKLLNSTIDSLERKNHELDAQVEDLKKKLEDAEQAKVDAEAKVGDLGEKMDKLLARLNIE